MKVMMNNLQKVKAEEILEQLPESEREMFRFMSSSG